LAIVAAATVPQRRRDLAGVVVILFLLCLHLYAAVLNHGLLGDKMDVAMRDIGPYVERYKAMPGKKLLTDELIAARVGEVAGLDWVLLEHLMHKGLIDVSPLCRQIADGDYDVCVFATLPITALEMTMYTLAANGPYRLIFKDNTLVEFGRIEKPTREK
jgi:hypothetical protein